MIHKSLKKLKLPNLLNKLRLRLRIQKKYRRRALVILFTTILVISSFQIWKYFSPKEASAEWFDESWSFRKKLTINASQVSGSTNLTNFPVLVSLTSDANLAAGAQADGDDIMFVAEGGNKLDHEIESYSSGTLVAWVRIPTLSATNNTSFYLYYGNPSASSQQNPEAVWDSNYKGVWHLDEEQAGTANANLYTDSTSNGNDGDDYASATGQTGKVNGGQEFDGADDYINTGLTQGYSTYTLSAWIDIDSFGEGGLGRIIDKRQAGSEVLLLYVNGTQQTISFNQNFSGIGSWRAPDNAISTTGWYHIFLSYDATNPNNDPTLHINGVSQSWAQTQHSTGSYATNSDSYLIGNRGATDRSFDGFIDEVRISDTIRSADWAITEYNNQNSPATFYSTAAQEKGPGPVSYWKFDEGADNTCSGGSNDACDATSGGNDGAFGATTAAPTWQSEDMCISGNCLWFDGSDDIATVTNADPIDFDVGLDGGFTISTWVKANSDGESNMGQIFQKGTNTYLRVDSEGSDGLADLEFNLDLGTTDANVNVVNGITLNRWHLVTVTHDGASSIEVYIDGVSRGSNTGSGTMVTDANNLLIGGTTTANFHGFVDEFKVYNYVRSEEQVKTDSIKGASASGSSATFGYEDKGYLSDGLVGYWQLNETSGNANDASGNTTTLTNISSTAYSSAKFGNGMEPDGTADYLHAADNAILSITGSMTLSAWIQPDDTTGSQNIIAKWDGSNESYMLAMEGANLRMYLDSSSNYEASTGTPITANTFQHVAGVYDATTQTVKLFVNGNQVASSTTGTIPASIGDDAGQFHLGAEDHNNTPKNFYDGHIDEARVYNRALSPAEIQKLYTWAPGPIGYWAMDENTGTSTTYDRSGNGHNGALSGIAEADWQQGKFGSALNFNATSDYVNIYSSSLDSDFSADSGTAMAWVKVSGSGFWTDNAARRVLNLYDDADNNITIYKNTSNQFQTDYEVGSTHKSYTYATTSTDWMHVAMTWDQANDRVVHYLNGVAMEIDTGLGTNSVFDALESNRTVIGNHRSDSPDQGWDGLIDEVKIYNYPRTSSQITEDMNAGHPAPGSPVGSAILHWKFDETYTGTTHVTQNSGSDPALTGSFNTTTLLTSSGKFGRAASFTNAAARISLGSGSSFMDSLTTVTISIWVNPQSLATNNAIISQTNHSNNNRFLIRTNSSSADEIDFYVASNSNDTSNFFTTTNLDLTTDTWQLLTFVYDGTVSASDRIKVYKNAVQVTGSVTGTIPASLASGISSGFHLGGSAIATPSNDALISYMDDLKIFTSALTADQIKILFNQSMAISLGALGTDASGKANNSSLRSYCVPGDASTCTVPVAHYPLDANTGQRANNYTEGGGSSLSLGTDVNVGTDDPIWVPGKLGAALKFDGTNDFANGANDSALNIGSDDFTIEAWVNRSATGANHVFVSKGGRIATTGAGYVAWIDTSSNVVRLQLNDGTRTYTLNGTTTITTPGWHHVVFVIDRDNETNTTIYINGIKDKASSTCSPSCSNITNITSMTSAQNFRLGSQPASGNPFNGMIDNVIIYNYARTPAQVAWSYNHGGPIAWWRFDECQGTTANDASGNGNNGTITPGSGTAPDNNAVGTCSSGNTDEMWNDGTTGKFNASLGFDGSDDYVNAGSGSMLDQLNTLTACAWIYPTAAPSSYPTIVSKYSSSVGWDLYLQNDGDLGTSYNGSVYKQTTNTPISLNNWYHVCGVQNGEGTSNMSLYINGVNQTIVSTGGSGSRSNDSSVNVIIGNNADFNLDFEGLIDDVRIYNYALSQDQVRTVMNHGSVRFGPAQGNP